MGKEITIYGTEICVDCINSRRVLNAFRVEFTEIHIDNPEGWALFLQISGGSDRYPILIFLERDGEQEAVEINRLVEPNPSQLVATLRELEFIK